MKIIRNIIMILAIIILPININAETYNEAAEKASEYLIKGTTYRNSYNNYLIVVIKNNENDNKYYIGAKEEFRYGGLLSYKEFQITNPTKDPNDSYLYDGSNFWTYTNGKKANSKIVISNDIKEVDIEKPDGNQHVKVTEYIKNDVKVNGSGTKNDPWVFLQMHTITFDHQGGINENLTDSVIAAYGEELPDIGILPKKPGYILDGYFTDIEGQGNQYYGGNGKGIKIWDIPINTTLYAKWKPAEYTIGFNKNGGSGGSESVKATYGKPLQAIEPPKKTGYVFSGYFTGIVGGENQYYYEDGKSDKIWNITSENPELYAKWTANKYTITFNQQSGSGGTASKEVTYGSAMPAITKPTRTGYTFGGYYTAVNGGGTQYYTAAGESARTWDKASNTTLYAKWIANKYQITYNQQSGSGGTASKEATYGSAMPAITKPTRTGYTFGGYYTAVNGGGTQYYTAAGESARTWNLTSNTILYAKWTANKYTITFNQQSGSGGTTSATATYASGMPSITKPTRTGYIFEGYYTAVNGGGTQYYTSAGESARTWNLTSNTTLYAKWVVSKPTCSQVSSAPWEYFTYTGSYNVKCGIGGQNGTDWKIEFYSNGTFTPKMNYVMDIFLLGGGGGGGSAIGAAQYSYVAGGGGGGGYTNTVNNVTITNGTSYWIQIGAGGSGGTQSVSGHVGGNGGASYFGSYSAAGGSGSGHHGGSGGSGGGASGNTYNFFGRGGNGGSNGGNGTTPGGNGIGWGQGTTTMPFGLGIPLAGGGGGGTYQYGGGSGGYSGGANGGLNCSSGASAPANSGGGGGGGGVTYYCGSNGGRGGSGIVIVRNK